MRGVYGALAHVTSLDTARKSLKRGAEPHPLADLATRCLANGVASLSADEQTQLKEFFLKEARKKAFDPVGEDDAIRTAFCEHVQREFAVPESVLTVIDCLPYFERTAKRHVGDSPFPLTALILYAAWIEHWVNVFIVVAMLRNRENEAAVEKYLDETRRFDNKVKRVRELATAGIPERAFDWITQLMAKRKTYVHYLWKGVPRRSIDGDLKNIASLVRNGEAMISELRAFEHANFDAPLLLLAERLFPLAA